MAPAQAAPATAASKPNNESYRDRTRDKDVRLANIVAAKAVADAVRTSLGPRGMDKMIQHGNGEVLISNDGATILDQMQVEHPAAKMLVDVAKSQDIEAGDGTTTVTVLAGSLLQATKDLLTKGIHPTTIAESFLMARNKADEILTAMSSPIDLTDRETLIRCATTSLSSKVVASSAQTIAPLCVDAVLKIMPSPDASNVDLRDIKVLKKLGETIDETEMVEGLVFTQAPLKAAGGPQFVDNAKIGLIQFCISPPKTDVENTVVVSDYAAMDRILREERKYILDICKKIKAAGCNVLLVQKSILREAVSELALHYLAKMKIMVIRDIERSDIEFVSKTLGCTPVATVDSFTADALGSAKSVAAEGTPDGPIVRVTGIENEYSTVSLLVRGSNSLVLDEAERSIHDALCVVRSLVKRRSLISGGGAPEIEVALGLLKWSNELSGMHQYCVRAYADALEIIPYTLAENAGLDPIKIVTELRNRHQAGEKNAGINVKKGTITDMRAENVMQPLLVSTSAFTLSTEVVRMLLKIDDLMLTA